MSNFSTHLKNIPYGIHLRGQTSSLWKRAILGKIFSLTCSDLRYVYIKIVHLGFIRPLANLLMCGFMAMFITVHDVLPSLKDTRLKRIQKM